VSKQTRRLTLAATRIATTADALGESFARALGQVLRGVERRLSGLVRDVQGGSRTAIVQASQADALRRGIRSALFAAGYDELATSAMGTRLDTLTTRVLQARRLAKQSAELVGPMTARLIALREVQLSELLDEGDSLAQALSQSAMRGLFGSRDVNRILDDLGLVVDRTESQIRTLYDTSVSVYGRAVEAVQAGDDPDTPFAYMGPVDSVTRPFCLQHVGKVYTRAQIDDLDNGQLGDVFLTGGGYQCRHVWQQVSKFSALSDLVGTRNRVPEIQEQVRELRRAA
jgi:hypothetical protein